MPKERTGEFGGKKVNLAYIDVALPYEIKRSLRMLAGIKGISMSRLCGYILYLANQYRSGELSMPDFQRSIRCLLMSPERLGLKDLPKPPLVWQ